MDVLAIIFTVLLVAVIGVMAGILIGTNRMKKAVEDGSVGNLRIDRSEVDEAPRAFLEIVGTSLEAISHKDLVMLKVINENYISRD